MIAESPRTMMVLTVDVICYGSADGHEACAGSDGKKPPFWKKYVENIGQADTAFATDHARRFVETENAVEALTLDEIAACVEARIPVTPSQTKRKQTARFGGVEDPGYLVIPGRLV